MGTQHTFTLHNDYYQWGKIWPSRRGIMLCVNVYQFAAGFEVFNQPRGVAIFAGPLIICIFNGSSEDVR